MCQQRPGRSEPGDVGEWGGLGCAVCTAEEERSWSVRTVGTACRPASDSVAAAAPTCEETSRSLRVRRGRGWGRAGRHRSLLRARRAPVSRAPVSRAPVSRAPAPLLPPAPLCPPTPLLPPGSAVSPVRRRPGGRSPRPGGRSPRPWDLSPRRGGLERRPGGRSPRCGGLERRPGARRTLAGRRPARRCSARGGPGSGRSCSTRSSWRYR